MQSGMTRLVLFTLFSLIFRLGRSSNDLPILQTGKRASRREDGVLQMQAHDQIRLKFLSSLAAGRSFVPIAPGWKLFQTPRYVIRVDFGSPAQTMVLALDTSSDVAWLPCAGCTGCSASTAFFDPSKSSTSAAISCNAPQCAQIPPGSSCAGGGPCVFNFTYGSSSVSAGLVKDTIKLSADPVLDYSFGCVKTQTGQSAPPQGLLGLGRGPLSLMSQTNKLYQSIFSYCLPSPKSSNFSGTLRLGPVGQPKTIKTTSLLTNPKRASLYYVKMVAIRVGIRLVDITSTAFEFNPLTGAGTIIDSGTVYTRLVAPAYNATRNAFRNRLGRNLTFTSLGGFDTCFSLTPFIRVPTISFLFVGMNVTLPVDNLLIRSTAGNTACLAMAPSPADPVNSVLNVIASTQLQNHRILIDVPNSRLGVARELCTS